MGPLKGWVELDVTPPPGECGSDLLPLQTPAGLIEFQPTMGPSTVESDKPPCRLWLQGSTTQAGNNHRHFIYIFIEFYRHYTGITSFLIKALSPEGRNGTKMPHCCFSIQPHHKTFCILYNFCIIHPFINCILTQTALTWRMFLCLKTENGNKRGNNVFVLCHFANDTSCLDLIWSWLQWVGGACVRF